MAKLHNKNVQAALAAIIASGRVTKEVGEPLMKQGLIEVNLDDVNEAGAAARLTQKGHDGMPKDVAVKDASWGGATSATSEASDFAIITNAVPPESKRGAGRVAGPSKYPFDKLPVNGSFFVAVSDEIENPVKTLGSAVTNATNKHRVDTGKTEQVTRAVREGKKAKLGEDGKKIMETVTVPVYDYPVKFVIRSVKKDQKCGEWVAPSDGALITRTK